MASSQRFALASIDWMRVTSIKKHVPTDCQCLRLLRMMIRSHLWQLLATNVRKSYRYGFTVLFSWQRFIDFPCKFYMYFVGILVVYCWHVNESRLSTNWTYPSNAEVVRLEWSWCWVHAGWVEGFSTAQSSRSQTLVFGWSLSIGQMNSNQMN